MSSTNPVPTGSRALRRGRISATGHIYLVTFTTFERARIFIDFDDACMACRTLSQPDLWQHSRLLAWVLMPDHWHGLVQLGDRDSLATSIARMKSAITRELRKQAARQVRVWASGFHDHALRREDDLRAMARYIVLNPVRAGLVGSAWCYPFWDAIWVDGLVAGRR
jgi:REP element-mobilizing transposase RayT